MTIRVRGMRGAQSALNMALKRVDTNNRDMLTVMLQAISAHTMPYVPVDSSTLINSEVRKLYEVSDGTLNASISYGASGTINPESGTPVQEYAYYVHDGPQKRWQKPGASNEYLRKGVKDFMAQDFWPTVKRFMTL